VSTQSTRRGITGEKKYGALDTCRVTYYVLRTN
jgi:hypothetical protein